MHNQPLDLREVYRAIINAYPANASPPQLPERTGSPEYNAYRDAFTSVIESVPSTPGVYLWFARKDTRRTEFIYVGESQRQGLHERFRKEFSNWHHCFWATAFHTDKYLPEALNIYVESARYQPKKAKYTNSICNDWLKRDATHLVYRTGLSKAIDLKFLQNDLIQLFGNPRGNLADIRAVPFRQEKMLPISKSVYEEVLSLTHKAQIYEP